MSFQNFFSPDRFKQIQSRSEGILQELLGGLLGFNQENLCSTVELKDAPRCDGTVLFAFCILPDSSIVVVPIT